MKHHKRNPHRIIPEFERAKKTPARAGFVPWPNGHTEEEVELWQIWLHSHDGEDIQRATFQDLEDAGFRRKR